MTTGTLAPTHVASRPVLADLELVLDGVLPSARVLGGPVSPDDVEGETTVQLADAVVATTLDAGSLVLVDEEQTPLARLVEVAPAPGGVRGRLERQRRRESGSGRSASLDLESPLAEDTLVVVLGRPPVAADTDRVVAALPQGTTALVLLVPDDARDTAGVPTHVVLAVAAALGDRVRRQVGGLQVSVRTAPLAWRDAASDAALLGWLARRLATTSPLLLTTDTGRDELAPAWAGAVEALVAGGDADAAGLAPEDLPVLARWKRPRSRSGLVVFFTGFSGSGKSTIARALHERLLADGQRTVTLLDGDVVRQMLSSGLGFDRAGRTLNIRRIGFVAAEIARHGGIAVCAPVAPYDAGRKEARAMAEAVGDFLLVHVSTPLEECERRDLKGLYAKARAGLVPEFTGISDPYDVPDDAELVIDTTDVPTDVAVDRIIDHLTAGGWILEKTS